MLRVALLILTGTWFSYMVANGNWRIFAAGMLYLSAFVIYEVGRDR